MAPLTPSWQQPSHPTIQEVIYASKDQFLTKSISKISLPPYALYAKMEFPPCTRADNPTYATVQMGVEEHLNLNSDLVYINHSCEPSLIFNTKTLTIQAGPRGLAAGSELTFFYPSTEWAMDQPFKCFCGTSSCRGWISGARDMQPKKLEGYFLNEHIRKMLKQRDGTVPEGTDDKAVMTAAKKNDGEKMANGERKGGMDAIEALLVATLAHAHEMVAAAQKALDLYKLQHGHSNGVGKQAGMEGRVREHDVGSRELSGEMGGDTRRGVTSRELSGEMGGDTVVGA